LNKKTKNALENYKLSMRLKREQINTSLEQNHESALANKTINANPYQELLLMSMNQSAIKEIVLQMKAGDYRKVKTLLENYIKVVPEDIVALGMLAEVMSRLGDNKMAVELMSRVVVLAPGFLQGHQQLIEYLSDVNDAERALKHSFILIEKNPLQWKYLILHASILVAAKKFTEAIRIYDAVFKQTTGSAFHWMRYAFVKKILGETDAAIKALRTALDRDPLNTGAWFELSNMKIPVLDNEDVRKMEKLVVGGEITDKVRLSQLHFSLGKAYEDNLAYEESFEHYEKANKLRRSTLNFDISDIRAKVDSLKSILNQELIEKIQSKSKSNDAPIFIVGLHRSGTTLVEQILSSHSYVEGTRELPYMIEIAQDLKALNSEGQHVFNDKLIKDLGVADLRILSNQYLSQARKEKNTNKKFMIDKMPNNWLYVWLIQILFPRAKIIDIRKQPMSSGFSLYKMNFYENVDHAFDQKEIAQFYIEYVNFMKHMDSIMPQKIHHIKYEKLVTDSVSEIKRLLDFCELPDEKSCYRHWEYKRAVQTPSAEQVRQPIYDDSKDLWKNYAQWLDPMQKVFNQL
jgi:tetratricopeptide (TPR) repeat protein